MTVAANWVVFQPLIVGLGAVILATLGNTLLEWHRQRLTDRREARTVRRAFLEEMRTHRRMYAQAISAAQREETAGSLMIPADQFLPVHDNMIGKIGVLEPDEVGAILHAYSFLILAPKNLGLLGQLRKDEYSSWIQISVRYAEVVDNLHKSLIEVLDEAISELTKRS